MFHLRLQSALWCWLLLMASGCSSGRIDRLALRPNGSTYASDAYQLHQPSGQCAADILSRDSPNRKNTLFAHPGMPLLSINSSLATDAAIQLKDEGFAGSYEEVSHRDAQSQYERMMKDPGTQFVGIHYSMGGKPEVLRSSFDAARQASSERGEAIRYHSILIDPVGISGLEGVVDLERPEVGYLFIILSSENSFLRPDLSGFTERSLSSGKVYFVHAEDLGEHWDHFGALTDFKTKRLEAGAGGEKVEKLFHYLMTVALASNGRLPVLNRHCTVAHGPDDLPSDPPADPSRKSGV